MSTSHVRARDPSKPPLSNPPVVAHPRHGLAPAQRGCAAAESTRPAPSSPSDSLPFFLLFSSRSCSRSGTVCTGCTRCGGGRVRSCPAASTSATASSPRPSQVRRIPENVKATSWKRGVESKREESDRANCEISAENLSAFKLHGDCGCGVVLRWRRCVCLRSPRARRARARC
eukprot:86835-Rhodomonas_salina.1